MPAWSGWTGPAGWPLSAWPAILLATTAIYRGDYRAADSIHGAVARRSGALGTALRARLQWGLGLTRLREGRLAEARAAYLAAADGFRDIGERSELGAIEGQLVDTYHLLGEAEAALTAGTEALLAFCGWEGSPLRHNTLMSLGLTLEQLGLPHAALVVHEVVAADAPRTGRPKDVVEAHARLAHIDGLIDDLPAALAELGLGRTALSAVGDPIMRARMEAELAAAAARTRARSDPRGALAAQDAVVRYYAEQAIPIDLAPALAERAGLRLRLADSAGAASDLADATALITRGLAAIEDAVTRADLLAAQADITRATISLALARGDDRGAFTLATHGRSRARPAGGSPTVPPGAAYLRYVVLPDRLALFLARPSGVTAVVVPVSREGIGRLVDELTLALARAGDSMVARRALSAAGRVLIAPLANLLGSVDQLRIDADPELDPIAFAALPWDSTRFLIQRFALEYVTGPDLPRGRRGIRPRRPVLVANPGSTPAAFPLSSRFRAPFGRSKACAGSTPAPGCSPIPARPETPSSG